MKKILNLLNTFFSLILDLSMVALGLVLTAFLVKQTLYLGQLVLISGLAKDFYSLGEAILGFFLLFEFLSLVLGYFKSDKHVSLNYFLYIGITASLRAIMVVHDDGLRTLLLALSIIVLVGALQLLRWKNHDDSFME